MIKQINKNTRRLITYILVFMMVLGFSVIGLGATPQQTYIGQALNVEERIYSDFNSEIIFPGEQGHEEYAISSRGSSPIEFYTERVNFHTRVQRGFVMNPAVPSYLAHGYTCGITAGGVAIAYYNRQFPQLIPGHTAGFYMGNIWLWNPQNQLVDAMFGQLFMLMGGNPAGVTIVQYVTGMMMYVALRGRSIQMQSLRTGSNRLNETALKNAFRSGMLVSLFAVGFSIVGITGGIVTNANHDLISHNIGTENHVMMAYGYRYIRYYNASNQLIRRDIYLYVNTGLSTPRLALTPITRFMYVADAFTTRVI
ncbi:MAG: hypothetical protein FWE13_04140 [Firmicutes bacterium]|nr:hypothetical protein [Bacillota bacterium]